MSGLAFPNNEHMAICTKIHEVVFDGKVLWDEKNWDPKEDAPPTFECDPTDNSKLCELIYFVNPNAREID